MAFKAHTTFRPRPVPEVTTVVEEVFEDENGDEQIRLVKKNVNELSPRVDAMSHQLINQINAGVPVRRVSTLMDKDDRIDTETVLSNVPRETPAPTEN